MIARWPRLGVEIARRVGTPVFVYDLDDMSVRARGLQRALRSVPSLVCFAVKANSNLALLRRFAKLGCGADVVSGGELRLARRAGIPASRIVFAGVGKTEDEIALALKERIALLNVESSAEGAAVSRVASRMGLTARVGIRVNPDVDPGTHRHISTGQREVKFGIPYDGAEQAILALARLPQVSVEALDVHIGSQIVMVAPFEAAIRKMLALRERLARRGILINTFDVGGGLGIVYDRERPPSLAEYGRRLTSLLKSHGVRLIVEPGRYLVGQGGYLLTRVLYRKQSHRKRFVIVDAGMNDLIRPALYDAFHRISVVKDKGRSVKDEGKTSSIILRHSTFETVDVVGPICETADFLAKNRRLPTTEEGDLLVVHGAGAYGYSMASNYNMRPRAAEVMVEAKGRHGRSRNPERSRRIYRWKVIRRRETFQDLIKLHV